MLHVVVCRLWQMSFTLLYVLHTHVRIFQVFASLLLLLHAIAVAVAVAVALTTRRCRVECRIKSIIVPLNEINKTNNTGHVLLLLLPTF